MHTYKLTYLFIHYFLSYSRYKLSLLVYSEMCDNNDILIQMESPREQV